MDPRRSGTTRALSAIASAYGGVLRAPIRFATGRALLTAEGHDLRTPSVPDVTLYSGVSAVPGPRLRRTGAMSHGCGFSPVRVAEPVPGVPGVTSCPAVPGRARLRPAGTVAM